MITRNMYAQSLDNVHSGEARLKVYFSIQSEQVNGIQTKYRNKCSLVNLLVVYCCDLSTTVTPFDLPFQPEKYHDLWRTPTLTTNTPQNLRVEAVLLSSMVS